MKLLHIDSSILGEASASRQLTREIVEAWRLAEPELEVVYRDLAGDDTTHLSGQSFAAAATPAELRDHTQQHEAALSAAVMEEFLAADLIVLGAPMYNFSVPSQLKAWIDRVAVAGKTFRYTETGPVGLAGGKRVVIASTAGGLHAGQPTAAGHDDYLRLVFGFLGITEVEFIHAHGLSMGPEARERAFAGARGKIERLFEPALA